MSKKELTEFDLKMLRAKRMHDLWLDTVAVVDYNISSSSDVYKNDIKKIIEMRSVDFWKSYEKTISKSMDDFLSIFDSIADERASVYTKKTNEESQEKKKKSLFSFLKKDKIKQIIQEKKFNEKFAIYKDEIENSLHFNKSGQSVQLKDRDKLTVLNEYREVMKESTEAKKFIDKWKNMSFQNKVEPLINYTLNHNGEIMPNSLLGIEKKDDNIYMSTIGDNVLEKLTDLWVNGQFYKVCQDYEILEDKLQDEDKNEEDNLSQEKIG